jgi:16S rRNA (guanine966-N2)-methyltransferase
MSIVQPELPGAHVLDLFAGSGALGLEALSRGARSADLVERSAAGVRAIRQNAESLGARERIAIHRQDAMRFIARLAAGAYDVAFADPPYGHHLAPQIAQQWLTVPFAHLIGIEHDRREHMPEGGDTRRYGSTAITFYRVRPDVS